MNCAAEMSTEAMDPGRPRPVPRDAGFSLIELLVAMIIIAILALIGITAFGNIKQQVKETRCMEELRGIEQAIMDYTIEKSALPDSLDDLGKGTFIDPWGNPIVYVNLQTDGPPRKDIAVNDVNTDYDLYSKGRDNLTDQLLSAAVSGDDVLRGADGSFHGLGINY